LFLRRLPLELRGPLVRIEAQDHYLKIVTERGSTLILMRLGEAVEALDGVRGLQTHRSHWVSLDAVTAHRRMQGRDVLVMSDGAEVPVARGKRDAARQAGLF
jgi:DNA-binding LytR/AlgR family response regulator